MDGGVMREWEQVGDRERELTPKGAGGWVPALMDPLLLQEIKDLPDYNKISFKEQAPVPLEEVLPDAAPQALDLLGHFLLYPPRQRIAASQVG